MSSALPPSGRSIHNDATEAIPPVGPPTKPLPVVPALPVDETAERAAAEAATPAATLTGEEHGTAHGRPLDIATPAAREVERSTPESPGGPAEADALRTPEPVGTRPASTVRSGPTVPSGPTAWRARSRRLALLVALAVVAGSVTGVLLRQDRSASSSQPAGAAVRIDAQVSSLDPSGGSGLRSTGEGWRTQSYNSADFGGLKAGVGLVLDLGSPRAVTTVVLTAAPPGSTIGLRTADERPTSGADLRPVATDVEATGKTLLDGRSGGAHRYWLVWISKLGARDGGYGVTLSDPVVTGLR